MDSVRIKNMSPSFSVYNAFVDKYMKDANASFVKVYLYILRHSSSDSLSLDSISDGCSLLKSDVVSALKYWAKEGVISYTSDSIEIHNLSGDTVYEKRSSDTFENEKADDVVPDRRFQPNTSVSANYRAADVIKTVNSNESLAHLFAIISQLLNKSLTQNDYKTIYSFIDYLKLPEQVVIVLFEYCVSIKKTSMRYIEKIAYSWADNGINTPELALKFVKEKTGESSLLSEYKKKFKISGRDFSDTEEEMLLSWINDCKASDELIMKAYDITVLNTGKVLFKYMDAIIRDEVSHSNRGAERTLPTNVKKSSFRNYPKEEKISDIEKKMIEKMMSQYGGESDAVNK